MANRNNNNKNTTTEKEESLLVTKESFAASGIIFSALLFFILCTRSFIFGDLGLGVHSFLTGTLGYLAYPVVLGMLYLSVAGLLGKRWVKDRRLFTLIVFTLLSAALIVHTALTFAWEREGYLAACFQAGMNFPAVTVTGWLGGGIVFGVSAVLSNIGAILFFSALTVFLGYLCVITIMNPVKEEKVGKKVKKAEKKATIKEEVQEPMPMQMPAPAPLPAPMQMPVYQQKPTYQAPASTYQSSNAGQGNSIWREFVPMQPQMEQGNSSMGAFSPFGTPSMMEQQPEPPKPPVENGKQLLFGTTPADNFKTNLIFDPNASVNKRPPVEPTEFITQQFTPSYTNAYENAINAEPQTERPVMVVDDRTEESKPLNVFEEPAPVKLDYLAEEKPEPLHTANYPSFDTPPTPIPETVIPQTDTEIDFKKIREEANASSEENSYKRHEYMEMFSPENPRLFEQNDFGNRGVSNRFPNRDEVKIPSQRESFGDDEPFARPSSGVNGFVEEPRGEHTRRDFEESRNRGLHLFDEDENDNPYKLRSNFDEKPNMDRGGREITRGGFGFEERNPEPIVRDVPETPRGEMPIRGVEEKAPEAPKKIKPRVIKPYKRMSLDDLDCRDNEPAQNAIEVEETKQTIIALLEEYKITGASITSVSFGPTVTRYNVAFPRNISPQKIVSLDQSIALSLRASGINIYPNYEDGVVSIEVPNKERQFVKLGCMLSGNTFVNAPSTSLMFAMGKNVANAKVYGDISKMIHLLVAGSSGSGKSVFLGALIISMIYKYSPEELRLILIDPKKTEFVLYNDLPHLMINEIITDVHKAVQSLNWAIGEMNRRYGLFEQMSRSGTYVVNLDEYNAQLVKRGQKNEKLPKIVIIIDELADLMLAAKKEMEDRIQNLTQKARAAGIHLIVATQRPSTDVITGVIKSNLATRIAFNVASDVDSRVILDQSGAQKLLGKGDLLYTMPGVNTPVRVQSAFISPDDSQKVVNFIKENNEAYYDEEATAYINNTKSGGDDSPAAGGKGEIDPLFIEALRHVILSGSASISMIQRKCSAGYNRAGRIIEWMEDMKYISAFDGAKARKVLITKEEFESMYGPLQ